MVRNCAGFACLWLAFATAPLTARAAEPLQITSSAFSAGGAIPVQYTCEGDDSPPPLAWSNVPAGTQSLLLIVAHDLGALAVV